MPGLPGNGSQESPCGALLVPGAGHVCQCLVQLMHGAAIGPSPEVVVVTAPREATGPPQYSLRRYTSCGEWVLARVGIGVADRRINEQGRELDRVIFSRTAGA